MRAASEHPRIAAAIAAALIVIALAGVGAGSALGGSGPIRRSANAQRVAEAQLAQLRRGLQISRAQNAQLHRQVSTLTAELARAHQRQQRAPTDTHPERTGAKR